MYGAQFSNGCTIGCPRCDGSSDHFGHGSAGTPAPVFIYKGPKPIPPWTPTPGAMVLDPSKPSPVARSICGTRRTTNATICDPRLRTINVQAECGSAADIFYFSPWRAPGSAPVIDSWWVLTVLIRSLFSADSDCSRAAGWVIYESIFCDCSGAAGGRFAGTGFGKPGSGASFQNSTLAKLGDLGSKVLPPVKASEVTTWHAGGTAEAGWTLEAQVSVKYCEVLLHQNQNRPDSQHYSDTPTAAAVPLCSMVAGTAIVSRRQMGHSLRRRSANCRWILWAIVS